MDTPNHDDDESVEFTLENYLAKGDFMSSYKPVKIDDLFKRQTGPITQDCNASLDDSIHSKDKTDDETDRVPPIPNDEMFKMKQKLQVQDLLISNLELQITALKASIARYQKDLFNQRQKAFQIRNQTNPKHLKHPSPYFLFC